MLLKLAFLFSSGCLRWPVSCLRRKIWRLWSMTMISWLVMRRSARPSLIWRTASCLDTTPTVAYHRLTACRWKTGVWVHVGHLIFNFLFFFLALSVLVSTSGGTSWSHPRFWRTWLVLKACPSPGLKTTAHHSCSTAESTRWLNSVNRVSLSQSISL